jgi:hypothetical protein
MDKDNQILEVFGQHKGYARTKDILDAGLHHHYLDLLFKEGKVVKVKRGLYRPTQRFLRHTRVHPL